MKLKWFWWVLCVLFVCELAKSQEPLTPVPDTGGEPSGVDCDALARQIDSLQASITRTENRISFVETMAALEISAIEALQVQWLEARERGADPSEIQAIVEEINRHHAALAKLQAEIIELDATLADLKFRWIMAVLQHMMECR